MAHVNTALDIERQVAWEMQGISEGIERVRAAALVADPMTLPPGQRVLRACAGPLSVAITALQADIGADIGAAGKPPPWRDAVMLFEPMPLAVITVIEAFVAMSQPDVAHADANTSLKAIGRDLARRLQTQLGYDRWVTAQVAANREAKATGLASHPDLLAAMKHTYGAANSRTWAKWSKRLKLSREVAWSPTNGTILGANLLTLLSTTCPDWFTLELASTNRPGETLYRVSLTPQAVAAMSDTAARSELMRPALLPMVIPPNPWRYEGDTPVGGFIINRVPLVRSAAGIYGHDAGPRSVSDADLAAINAVQATPWRINRRLFDTLHAAWGDGRQPMGECATPTDLPLLGLAKMALKPLPPRTDEAVWAKMGPAERKASQAERAAVHQANASANGRSQALLDILTIGNRLRGQAAIYYPFSRDFRGRIYPVSVMGPQPQGSDLSRATIMFAEGRPLGPDGLFWLCVRAAGCAGRDKLPMADRVAWVLENQVDIERSARDPLVNLWWSETGGKEPWGLLATCFELAMAWQCGGDAAEFVSHLPIPLDGTCNGLQHLAAMGLDGVGARATNLCADVERQDIYETVASKVRDAVELDAAKGVVEALQWHGRVDRDTCKRAVMTTPYGVTASGIRTQLLREHRVPLTETGAAGQGAAAVYMRDRIVEALSATVSSATKIMAWLQTAADRMARANVPFRWQTPTGSTVQQAYRQMGESRCVTLSGVLTENYEIPGSPLNARKQSAGAAPNFVHSFDASHLADTVNRAGSEGVESFAMIHDSYGTHACHTTALGRVLRASFVGIYSGDWLESTAAFIRAYAHHVELPPLPVRGDFELAQVNHSEFFFS